MRTVLGSGLGLLVWVPVPSSFLFLALLGGVLGWGQNNWLSAVVLLFFGFLEGFRLVTCLIGLRLLPSRVPSRKLRRQRTRKIRSGRAAQRKRKAHIRWRLQSTPDLSEDQIYIVHRNRPRGKVGRGGLLFVLKKTRRLSSGVVRCQVWSSCQGC